MGHPPVTLGSADRSAPVLRPPPAPSAHAPDYWQTAAPEPAPAGSLDQNTLFEALREARVGGAFWGAPWPDQGHKNAPGGPVIIRSQDPKEADAVLAMPDGDTIVLPWPDIGDAPIDPWSVLLQASQLIAHGGDEWIALACALKRPVTVLSRGRFGKPGDAAETLAQRAFEELRSPMRDPHDEGWLDPLSAIERLSDWRRVLDGNRGPAGERIVAACGMSWWKRDEIRRFLWSPGSKLQIHRSDQKALAAAAQQGGSLAVWPSRVSADLEQAAGEHGVKLVRVEDGFVRSVGLGTHLVPPLSIIVDRQGIHYDPSRPSDLETILATTQFSDTLIKRAARLRAAIVEAGISKYAAGHSDKAAHPTPLTKNKRIVLVPGQVEDDMSVLKGGGGLTSNLELLRRARALEPEAEIWWRPHPDVDAGHRIGAIPDAEALRHADRIARDGSMSDLLNHVDGLHTITSLSGFEALMRGCEVTCHGVPFYSGWGLTRDLGAVPDRRGRALSLDQLVAGVLLLYPRYLDPVTGLPCPPEALIQRLANGQAANRLSWVVPLRRMQGWIMRYFRAGGGR